MALITMTYTAFLLRLICSDEFEAHPSLNDII